MSEFPKDIPGSEDPAKRDSKSTRGWQIAKDKAEKFLIPKSFATQGELLSLPPSIPRIVIKQKALLKIYVIVSSIEMEVGWLGTAKRTKGGVVIDDVFLFNQSVSYGHTELTTESMNQIMQDVLQRPNGEEVFNNVRFWGHSHGRGGTYPSSQDDDTMKIFGNVGADFFIRGIFNRKGDVNFSLYDWEEGIAFHHVPWKLIPGKVSMATYKKMEKELQEEMLARVQVPPPVIVPRRVKTYREVPYEVVPSSQTSQIHEPYSRNPSLLDELIERFLQSRRKRGRR